MNYSFNKILAVASITLCAVGAYSAEPDLDVMVDSIPVSIQVMPGNECFVVTQNISPITLREYYSTHSDVVNVTSYNQESELVSGVYFYNSTKESIQRVIASRPVGVYWNSTALKWEVVMLPGMTNGLSIGPGKAFRLPGSKTCAVTVYEDPSGLNLRSMSSYLNHSQENPGISYEYVSDGQPISEEGAKKFIDRAFEFWDNMLKNEPDTNIYPFKFEWSDSLAGGTVATANVDIYTKFYSQLVNQISNEDDTNTHATETQLYSNFPGVLKYARAGDPNDTASDIWVTGPQNVSVFNGVSAPAVILLNSNLSPGDFDTSPESGIDSGKYDAVGAIIHEMGHHFGFVTSLDDIAPNMGVPELTDTPSMWDIFRMGADDIDGDRVTAVEFSGATRELTVGVQAWGVTALQATLLFWELESQNTAGGHWIDYTTSDAEHIGLMDSMLQRGEALSKDGSYLQEPDIRAFDILGADIDDFGLDAPPEKRDNIEPEPGAQIDPTQPTDLAWTPGSSATSLHVYVYRFDQDMNKVDVFTSENLPAGTTAITIPVNTLIPGHHHEWFVTSENWRGYSYGDATAFFVTGSATCLPDTNGDGMLSPADFSAWVAAFNAMSPECDQNGDGNCTPADFSAWIANYNTGC